MWSTWRILTLSLLPFWGQAQPVGGGDCEGGERGSGADKNETADLRRAQYGGACDP